MARILFDTGMFSVIDEASAIGVGWQLNFYTADTVTRITTYAVPVGSTANTNPVLSDAGGRFPSIWIEEDQSIKWVLTTETGVVIMSQDDYAVPSSPQSFDPALSSFLAGTSPLPLANGGTGQTSAPNAIAALGGLPTTGGTMTGNIVRSTKGVHLFWNTAAMNNGDAFLTPAAASDPTTLPGQIWMKHT